MTFRRDGRFVVVCLIAILVLPLLACAQENREHVILFHGLCRTSRAMNPMERALSKAGYNVLNVDYPSRSASIEKLSEDVVGQAVNECQRAGAEKIHFVGHSLGAILIRDYLANHTVANLGRVVMLGPPNQGSEVVDKLRERWYFKKITGVAGGELGTDTNSVPVKLGPAKYPVGIIAGNRTMNWINSAWIPGPDDGKVSVERTKLVGMTDHMVISSTHTFLMRKKISIKQTIKFLQEGRFDYYKRADQTAAAQ